MDRENDYFYLLTGGGWTGVNPLLLTDAYKLSMAQAGFPLREETFYLSFRKPGNYLIPLDFKDIVRLLQKTIVNNSGFYDYTGLRRLGYGLTPAMALALEGALDIWAAPEGSWVKAKEPIITITGPSFLVSWLEPLVIMFNFPIQVATEIANGQREFTATCESEADIIRLLLEDMGVEGRVTVMANDYRDTVRANVQAAVRAVGDARRIFEVGFRSASCVEQHRIVVEECVAAGVRKTSNVALAEALGGEPVGTTGHEHQQRWGSDLEGFRAIRDMRPNMPSYLFDTFDAIHSGIPAAVQVLKESHRPAAVRFDSGDQDDQLRRFVEAGVKPFFIFEDGYTPEKAERNEKLCASYDIPEYARLYGFGGFLVSAPGINPFIRDRVQAVYKLSRTGDRNVMKHAGTKSSVPGIPVILRGRGISIIAQKGEEIPGFRLLGEEPEFNMVEGEPTYSTRTANLICLAKEQAKLE